MKSRFERKVWPFENREWSSDFRVWWSVRSFFRYNVYSYRSFWCLIFGHGRPRKQDNDVARCWCGEDGYQPGLFTVRGWLEVKLRRTSKPTDIPF